MNPTGRDRIIAGLKAFCSCEPDFSMSLGMMNRAAGFILGQPLSPTDHGPGADAQGEAGTCAMCAGSKWVCENHPNYPWSGIANVKPCCGGAGAPCRKCNHLSQQPDCTPCERTVRLCQTTVRNRMVEQEWPPQDGDQQIDEVLEALESLLPKQTNPAEELVAELLPDLATMLYEHDPMCSSATCDRTAEKIAPLIAAWLVSKEKLA